MPSMLTEFWIPQILGFFSFFIYGSFFEWTLHRFWMHKRSVPPYPYELHALIHHDLFRADETFHVGSMEALEHITFVPRDYLFLLLVNLPVLLAVEWAIGLPLAAGGAIGAMAYGLIFDGLHWCFHVPAKRWFEQLGLYRWIKRHHLLHHRHQDRNLNVVFPLADLCLGTLITRPRSGTVLQI